MKDKTSAWEKQAFLDGLSEKERRELKDIFMQSCEQAMQEMILNDPRWIHYDAKTCEHCGHTEYKEQTKPNRGDKMKKVTIPKKVQNELLKIMAANQNAKKKLNAGQLREIQSLLITALPLLSHGSTLALYATIEKLLVQKSKELA